MRHIDLLSDPTSWHLHLYDFNAEMDKIVAMHRFLVTVSERDFGNEWDRLMEGPGDGNYDGGDALWDAEKTVGVSPDDVASHAGLMAVTRAVSLTEVMLARLAAAHLTDPSKWVFPKGSLWQRDWEMKFYKTVLVARFNSEGSGFGALRSLRDLYVHGYGIPVTETRREALARSLYNQFTTARITPAESSLGYKGEAYFFGDDAEFSKKTQTLESAFFTSKRADISPLMTFRVLEQMRSHFADAHAAFDKGLVTSSDVNNSKYVKAVEAWWAKQDTS
ncbi:hypothetical protein [Frigoribacterium sp. 9N]|uniref:hypothetical protein n=1 Tax=Frigoribacterium sp. 9N TaxID=2653144 RepID=UPI0012F3991B|nr:hypothetical protein [Frigoribacterium sp. 9N]VXB72058.1 conserved hypothetical protein [Frigoribacterium sp. 9N]